MAINSLILPFHALKIIDVRTMKGHQEKEVDPINRSGEGTIREMGPQATNG